MKQWPVLLIRLVSGFFRAQGQRACRFHPSCSAYSIEAFERFHFLKAFWFMTKRILRCHPFSRGGYDPLIKTEF